MYLMSYFHPEERDGMFLACSRDLFEWEILNNHEPLIPAEDGCVLRDPFIIRDKDGIFHAIYTDNWDSPTIGHSASRDLIEWSKPNHIELMTWNDDTVNCWAPEAYYDREKEAYRLIWSTSFRSKSPYEGNRIWTALTKDFADVYDIRCFFDPGYTCIDATVLIEDDGYKMAFKDERGENRPGTDFKAIRTCVFKDSDAEFEGVSELITSDLSEGPCIVKKDGVYNLFFDSFGYGKYGVMTSTDFVNWTDESEKVSFPPKCRHMSIIECPDEIIENLR